jgi:hypothetical protein
VLKLFDMWNYWLHEVTPIIYFLAMLCSHRIRGQPGSHGDLDGTSGSAPAGDARQHTATCLYFFDENLKSSPRE